MKLYSSWIVAVMVLVLCESAMAAKKEAGGGDGKAPKKAAQAPAGNAPVVWLVDSLEANCCALAKTDFSARTNLIIGATTEIFVKGQLGKLSDIQVGMCAEFAVAGSEVTRLSLSTYIPPPIAAPAAKPQKEPKAAKAPAAKAPKKGAGQGKNK